MSSSYDIQAHLQRSQRCRSSQTALQWFEVLPGLSLALSGDLKLITITPMVLLYQSSEIPVTLKAGRNALLQSDTLLKLAHRSLHSTSSQTLLEAPSDWIIFCWCVVAYTIPVPLTTSMHDLQRQVQILTPILCTHCRNQYTCCTPKPVISQQSPERWREICKATKRPSMIRSTPDCKMSTHLPKRWNVKTYLKRAGHSQRGLQAAYEDPVILPEGQAVILMD